MESKSARPDIGKRILVEKYLAKGEAILQDVTIGPCCYFFTNTRLIRFERAKSIFRHAERFQDIPYDKIDYLSYSYVGPTGIWLGGVALILISVVCAATLHPNLLLGCVLAVPFFLDSVFFKAVLSLRLKWGEKFEMGGTFSVTEREETLSLITGKAIAAIRAFLARPASPRSTAPSPGEQPNIPDEEPS